MLVGEIVGKTGTKQFRFRAYKEVNRMDFVTVKTQDDKWVLAQVEEVEIYPDGKVICKARVLGYREEGILKMPKVPLKPSAMVYKADKKIISECLNLKKDGLYVGVLDSNEDVKVFLDPKEMISKHLAVLAATGSGKSYTVGVLIEEIVEKKIPVIVIDPHGEYISMRFPNDDPRKELFEKFDVKPKGYDILHYSPDPRVNPGAKQLAFGYDAITPNEIGMLFPTRPSASQIALLHAALKKVRETREKYDIDTIIHEIEQSNSQSKWSVINMLEMVKDMKIFSDKPTKISDMVVPGKITVVNLRGVPPDVQAYVVYKLVERVFESRKIGMINPCFLVIEEAHNFIPQSESRISAKIIKNVASEGRKFGLGLCVVSQRPARVDKNVISQCNTQIILKMTNPNDLKAVSYAEGISTEMEKEIRNLNVGTALIIGQEFPLFVKIRVRRSKHGGVTEDITKQESRVVNVFIPIKSFSLPKEGKRIYYPCWFVSVDGKNYLIDAIQGKFVYMDKGYMKEMNLEQAKKEGPKEIKLDYRQENAEGSILKREISQKIVQEICLKIFAKMPEKMEIVYYPYLIKEKMIIDCVTGAVKKLK